MQTQRSSLVTAAEAGWLGGALGNGLLGAVYSLGPVQRLFYDPAQQSRLFIELTPTRDIPVSVAGLVLLCALHGVLYARFRPTLPGDAWWRRGLFWGGCLWALYWLFQEWFIYRTLLLEPWPLLALELVILLSGALLEGLVIAFVVERWGTTSRPMAAS